MPQSIPLALDIVLLVTIVYKQLNFLLIITRASTSSSFSTCGFSGMKSPKCLRGTLSFQCSKTMTILCKHPYLGTRTLRLGELVGSSSWRYIGKSIKELLGIIMSCTSWSQNLCLLPIFWLLFSKLTLHHVKYLPSLSKYCLAANPVIEL